MAVVTILFSSCRRCLPQRVEDLSAPLRTCSACHRCMLARLPAVDDDESTLIGVSRGVDQKSFRMSVLTVQLGQCGNQIGAELYSTLFGEASGYEDADRERAHRVSASAQPTPIFE
eukprot:1191291-Prorocentrum_minimum.AAC.3